MYKINPEISIKKIADEIFMYNRQQSLIHSFNETGALILEAIQNQLDTEQICQKISSEYQIDANEVRKDTVEFIETLLQKEIIQKIS